MAASPAPAAKAGAKGGGNVLTKKLGPLPGWAWAALGVGAFYLWKKHEASTAAAASTATDATAQPSLPTSDVTAPSGYRYQGPGVGTGGSGAVPQSAMPHPGRRRSGVGTTASPNPTAAVPPATAVTAATTSPQVFY